MTLPKSHPRTRQSETAGRLEWGECCRQRKLPAEQLPNTRWPYVLCFNEDDVRSRLHRGDLILISSPRTKRHRSKCANTAISWCSRGRGRMVSGNVLPGHQAQRRCGGGWIPLGSPVVLASAAPGVSTISAEGVSCCSDRDLTSISAVVAFEAKQLCRLRTAKNASYYSDAYGLGLGTSGSTVTPMPWRDSNALWAARRGP